MGGLFLPPPQPFLQGPGETGGQKGGGQFFFKERGKGGGPLLFSSGEWGGDKSFFLGGGENGGEVKVFGKRPSRRGETFTRRKKRRLN